MNREAVQEELQREFDVPSDQLRDEIDTLIANLLEKKLLLPAVKLVVSVAAEERRVAPDTLPPPAFPAGS